MYLPNHFRAPDESARKLIDEHPFATLISVDENGLPFTNHLPLLLQESASAPGQWSLVGHMARRNPQVAHLANGAANGRLMTAVFHGPHHYITPSWYVSGRDVPTWNYAVVQTRGAARLIEGFTELVEILRLITGRFESMRPVPWEFELPDDLLTPAALTSAIVGFEIQIAAVEGKFKLSQNRSAEDRAAVIAGLRREASEASSQVADLMAPLQLRPHGL